MDNLDGVVVTMLLPKIILETKNNADIPMTKHQQLQYAQILLESQLYSEVHLDLIDMLTSQAYQMEEPTSTQVVKIQVPTHEISSESTLDDMAVADSGEFETFGEIGYPCFSPSFKLNPLLEQFSRIDTQGPQEVDIPLLPSATLELHQYLSEFKSETL